MPPLHRLRPTPDPARDLTPGPLPRGPGCRHRVAALTLAAALLAAGLAQAQGVCASDGQPSPRRLVERFIGADCADCWQQPGGPAPQAADLVLDWIVPGRQGDDAPLAGAASRDALTRLQALHRPRPGRTARHVLPVATAASDAPALRVAHGVPLGGYLGTAIEYRPPAPAPGRTGDPVSLWLVLVEALPAGTEGSPVARFLVRNTLQVAWNGHSLLSDAEQPEARGLRERRPMQIPEGAVPERLLVAGWVQDARGRVLAAARSVCVPAPEAPATER